MIEDFFTPRVEIKSTYSLLFTRAHELAKAFTAWHNTGPAISEPLYDAMHGIIYGLGLTMDWDPATEKYILKPKDSEHD